MTNHLISRVLAMVGTLSQLEITLKLNPMRLFGVYILTR